MSAENDFKPMKDSPIFYDSDGIAYCLYIVPHAVKACSECAFIRTACLIDPIKTKCLNVKRTVWRKATIADIVYLTIT